MACGLFFLGSHKESNLKTLAMARKHNLVSKDEHWKRFGKFQVFEVWHGSLDYDSIVSHGV